MKKPNDEQNEAEVTEWKTPVQETGQRTRSVMIVTVPDLPAPNNDAEDTAECCYKRLNVPHDNVKTNSCPLIKFSFVFFTFAFSFHNFCLGKLLEPMHSYIDRVLYEKKATKNMHLLQTQI